MCLLALELLSACAHVEQAEGRGSSKEGAQGEEGGVCLRNNQKGNVVVKR